MWNINVNIVLADLVSTSATALVMEAIQGRLKTPLAIVIATAIKNDIQVFATTHSEECIAAASRAFTAANDDGLRVIRLDRRQDKTVAAVYNRDLVETAIAADVEIRG